MAETILPSNSTPWERLVEQVSAERWEGIDADVLRRAQDPWTCPAHLLPWLAYNRGVDLWFDDWPEFRKRQAIAMMPRLKMRKGTIWAIAQYLALVDARLVSYDLPPMRPYLGAALTGARRQRWLAHLPQLRLYEHRSRFEPDASARFVGSSLVLRHGGAICLPDPAAAYYGVRAFLWKDGAEIPLKTAELVRHSVEHVSEKTVRIELPPRQLHAFRTGGPVSYLRPRGDAARQFKTVTLTRTNVSIDGDVLIHEVNPGYEPVEPRFEEVAEPFAPSIAARFVRRGALGSKSTRGMIAGRDPAYLHLYQRVYLYDEEANRYALRPHGSFVAGRSRLGLPPFTGVLRVDIREPVQPGGMCTVGRRGYLRPGNHKRLERAVEAVRCAQGGTDTFVVDTKMYSPLTLGDAPALDGSIRLGQQIRRF